jgi:hypothetical protein
MDVHQFFSISFSRPFIAAFAAATVNIMSIGLVV